MMQNQKFRKEYVSAQSRNSKVHIENQRFPHLQNPECIQFYWNSVQICISNVVGANFNIKFKFIYEKVNRVGEWRRLTLKDQAYCGPSLLWILNFYCYCSTSLFLFLLLHYYLPVPIFIVTLLPSCIYSYCYITTFLYLFLLLHYYLPVSILIVTLI